MFGMNHHGDRTRQDVSLQFKKFKNERFSHVNIFHVYLPIENAQNCFLLMRLPSLSKNLSGLNLSGFGNILGSLFTDTKLTLIEEFAGIVCPLMVTLCSFVYGRDVKATLLTLIVS